MLDRAQGRDDDKPGNMSRPPVEVRGVKHPGIEKALEIIEPQEPGIGLKLEGRIELREPSKRLGRAGNDDLLISEGAQTRLKGGAGLADLGVADEEDEWRGLQHLVEAGVDRSRDVRGPITVGPILVRDGRAKDAEVAIGIDVGDAGQGPTN